MTSATFTLNVVSIVIGVLIVRIIVAFFNTSRTFVESKVDYDLDEMEKDHEEFKRDFVGFLVVLGVAGFIIACITSWYRDSKSGDN